MPDDPMRLFPTQADRDWQLAKIELRLRCADGGGEWRDNLLRQRAALRAKEPTK